MMWTMFVLGALSVIASGGKLILGKPSYHEQTPLMVAACLGVCLMIFAAIAQGASA